MRRRRRVGCVVPDERGVQNSARLQHVGVCRGGAHRIAHRYGIGAVAVFSRHRIMFGLVRGHLAQRQFLLVDSQKRPGRPVGMERHKNSAGRLDFAGGGRLRCFDAVLRVFMIHSCAVP